MKLLMIFGGLMGFSIGFGFSLIQGTSWPSVLLRASVATYAAGALMRWWGTVWVKSLQQSYKERSAHRAKPKLPTSLPAKP
jgi:hypothetical protein